MRSKDKKSFRFGAWNSIRPEIELVLGLDFRMATLSSLTGVSPPASSALPCENPAPSPSPLSDWLEH